MNIKKYIRVTLCAVIMAFPFIGSSHVFAAESTTQNVQNAVESVKAAISDLITAKDEKKTTEAPLRIDTLKKAVTLAIDEAKDLRLKLLALEDLSKEYDSWRDAKASTSKAMIDTLDGFKKEISAIEKSDENTDDQVKALGTKIKNWRETEYLPFSDEVRDYLLVSDEYKTIETAKIRSEKIAADIAKLDKKKKKTDDLKKLLGKANDLIVDAVSSNNQASELFEKTYFPKKEAEQLASSTLQAVEQEPNSPIAPPKSIRDLVNDSSNKVRSSYKVFIEMSNLVRGLLK